MLIRIAWLALTASFAVVAAFLRVLGRLFGGLAAAAGVVAGSVLLFHRFGLAGTEFANTLGVVSGLLGLGLVLALGWPRLWRTRTARRRCPRCGTETRPAARFCDACAQPLFGGAPEEGARVTKIARAFGGLGRLSAGLVVGTLAFVFVAAIVYAARFDAQFGQWLVALPLVTASVAIVAVVARPQLFRTVVRTRGRAALSGVLFLSTIAGFLALPDRNDSGMIRPEASVRSGGSPVAVCDQQPAPPDVTRQGRPDLAFVLASPDGLLALDANGRPLGVIANLPRHLATSDMALLPDRRTLVFSLMAEGDDGSDIWEVDLGGSNLCRLVEHDTKNVFYTEPMIDPSGKLLYFHRREAVMRNGSAVGDAANSIERLDIATKQRTRVVDGAIDPTIAPDGKTIVYVNVADGARRALWRVGTDGSTARPFFSPPDTCCPGNSQGLVKAPRFSPDGTMIVFLSFSSPDHCTGECSWSLDLLLARPDGMSLKMLRGGIDHLYVMAGPNAAWSPDGRQLAFVGDGPDLTQLMAVAQTDVVLGVITVADGSVQLLANGYFRAGDHVLWVKR